MLIAGLIALLSLMFGDTDMPFLLPKEEKSIDNVIEDKVKRKQLKVIVKEVEKKEEQFKKDKKAYTKELEKLNRNRASTTTEFNAVVYQIKKVNIEAFDFMVKIRVTIADVITTDEWDAIIEDGKKRFDKTETKFEKTYPDFEKAINTVVDRAENIVSDKEKANLIAKRIRNFYKLTLKTARNSLPTISTITLFWLISNLLKKNLKP